MAGNQADVGYLRLDQPRKYAIKITTVAMTATITFVKETKVWYVCS
jgi:hypothetical protein